MKRILLIIIAIILSTSLFSQDLRGRVYFNSFTFSKGIDSTISKTIKDLVILNISSMTSVVYTQERDSIEYQINLHIDSVTTQLRTGKDSSQHYTSKISYLLEIHNIKSGETYKSTNTSAYFIPKNVVALPIGIIIFPETEFYKRDPLEAIQACANKELTNNIKKFIESKVLVPARITIIKKRSGYMKSLCSVNLGSANINKDHRYIEVISKRVIAGREVHTLLIKLRVLDITGENSSICRIDDDDIKELNKNIEIFGIDNIYIRVSNIKLMSIK